MRKKTQVFSSRRGVHSGIFRLMLLVSLVLGTALSACTIDSTDSDQEKLSGIRSQVINKAGEVCAAKSRQERGNKLTELANKLAEYESTWSSTVSTVLHSMHPQRLRRYIAAQCVRAAVFVGSLDDRVPIK